MTLGLPYELPPTGWFQICWSDEIERGAARPYHYFGRDLVAFRTDGGTVQVLDAYCPHMGAHLGYGAIVEGDEIICPFHGWRFDCTGCNTAIPFADRPLRARRVAAWPTWEINGWVMVWFDAEIRPPRWQPPGLPEAVDETYEVIGRRLHELARVQPQLVTENIVDAVHQVHVHGGSHPLDITEYEADDAVFRQRARLRVGVDKPSTWLTPDGETIAELVMEAHGLGIWISWHSLDETVHAQNTTPVDSTHSNCFATVYGPRTEDPADAARAERRFAFEMKHLARDMEIWEHMRFEPRPPWSRFEARPFVAFRTWARQFYPDASDEGVGE